MIAAQFERLKNGNKGHVRLTAPSSRYLKVIEEMPEVITALAIKAAYSMGKEVVNHWSDIANLFS